MKLKQVAGILCGAVLLAGATWSCGEDAPLGVDTGPIQPGQRGKVVQASLTGVLYDTTFSEFANTGDGPLLLVGRLNETETQSLVRFGNLPDSVVVHRAELVLFGRFNLGSGPDFEITVHNVTADWKEDEVNAESFNDSFDPAVIGSQMVAAADSDTVVVAIDTSLVSGWTDGSVENYGLLVRFSSAEFIKTFLSGNANSGNPELRLRYTSGDAVIDSTFLPTEDAFLARRTADLPPGYLYVGNGIADRAALRFDVSAIPSTATINRARLKLTMVPEQSVLTSDPIILAAFPLAERLEPGQSVAFDSTFRSPQFFLYDTTATVELDVADMLQAWVIGKQANNGLTIRSLITNRDITRVAFESRLASDEARRPRLEVDYTVPPLFNKAGTSRDE